MVLIAFIARVLYIVLAHSYRFRTTDANFSFGWEIGRIAYSLANGHGFSSPFGGDTGPSAWNAPVYPWIVSLAFRVFGSYTHAAAFALLTFNSLCAALTCWPIYRIARRVFNETVAVWSGWIWALLPYIIYWSVRWIWETSLIGVPVTLPFMLTVEMEGDNRLTSWFGYGVLWGVDRPHQSLSRCRSYPSPDAGSPINLSAAASASLLPAAVSAVVFWMTMMPWLVRNYEVFHKPVFVRDNVGVEIRCGNNPLAEGIWVAMYHPSQNPLLYEKYQENGRGRLLRREGRLAKQWITENPRQFAVITFRKFIFFWNGLPRLSKHAQLEQIQELALSGDVGPGRSWGLLLALKRRVHGVFLFASLMIVYPLVYYVSFTHPRYRHPIDPRNTFCFCRGG